MDYRPLAALLGTLCALLAGCNTRTNVSLTGNTPAQYSHVYLTTQAVWFNTSATAGPDDSGWVKFPLSTPTTVDLVAAEAGTPASLASDLRVLAGSYAQIRLIPLDSGAPLAAAAQSLGAQYNAEVVYVDSTGTSQQVPLELLNPEKGIGIQASLRVPVGGLGNVLGGSSTTGGAAFVTGANDATSGAGTGDALFGTTNNTTTSSTTGTGTTSTTTTTIASFDINIDGTLDLVPFTYAARSVNAVLFSSHATAYDLANVGTIQGTLTLTNLTSTTGGLPAIQVDAERLSTDGTRHVVVLTTTVNSSGDFTLYPLPVSSSSSTFYDLVIHGPAIATIIIKNVELPANTSTTSTGTTTAATNTVTGFGGTTMAGTGTTTAGTTTSTAATTSTGTTSTGTTSTGTTSTGTTSTGTTASSDTVSVGTLVPRVASSYDANISTAAGSALPAGAAVNFYQTLSKGSAPYVIETSTIDPFNQTLSAPQGLSEGTIDSGTYVTSGETVNIVSAAPVETAGHYRVAASAPGYSDGTLTPTVGPPKSGTALVPLPALSMASGTSPGSVAAAVTPANAAQYDQGQLLVSHEGTLVASVPLDTVLTQGGGTVSATVPAGTPSSYYYLSVRVWNSRNPAGTLSRQSFPTVLDLRSSSSATLPVTIN
jgi:mucin-2